MSGYILALTPGVKRNFRLAKNDRMFMEKMRAADPKAMLDFDKCFVDSKNKIILATIYAGYVLGVKGERDYKELKKY